MVFGDGAHEAADATSQGGGGLDAAVELVEVGTQRGGELPGRVVERSGDVGEPEAEVAQSDPAGDPATARS